MIKFYLYLTIINIYALASMGIDKQKAKKHKWRIKESTLILLAAIGGSIGILLGMKVFRHKTKHTLFTIGVPLILLAQIALAVYLNLSY